MNKLLPVLTMNDPKINTNKSIKPERDLQKLDSPITQIAKPTGQPYLNSKTLVHLPGGEVDWAATASGLYSVLAATGDYYRYEGDVVRLSQIPGRPTSIKEISSAEAISAFDRHIQFIIEDKLMPLKSQDARILLCADEKSRLPVLKGISKHHMLRMVEVASLLRTRVSNLKVN